MLAALNHPHIAAIYGVERSGDVQALVLELVEGETLAERLARGRLPNAEALAVCWADCRGSISSGARTCRTLGRWTVKVIR